MPKPFKLKWKVLAACEDAWFDKGENNRWWGPTIYIQNMVDLSAEKADEFAAWMHDAADWLSTAEQAHKEFMREKARADRKANQKRL